MTRNSTMRLRALTITCEQQERYPKGSFAAKQLTDHYGLDGAHIGRSNCGCLYLWREGGQLPRALGLLMLEELQIRKAGGDAPVIVH